MTDCEKLIKRSTYHLLTWSVFFVCTIPFVTSADSSDDTDSDLEGDEGTASENDSTVFIRGKIVDLIENELAQAYSYTASSTHRLPHFEVIDQIFPKWHHGNPSAARQFWVNADYRTFVVLYRVDYVYLLNDAAAQVEGKRLVIWSETEDELNIEKYWPFQLWASLEKRTQRDNSYLSAAYAIPYKMKMTLNEKGEWIVTEETLKNNPEMVNNIKNPCLYEKQLADWGLKNDCNKKLLPQ
jgi:hypothetical protein